MVDMAKHGVHIGARVPWIRRCLDSRWSQSLLVGHLGALEKTATCFAVYDTVFQVIKQRERQDFLKWGFLFILKIHFRVREGYVASSLGKLYGDTGNSLNPSSFPKSSHYL